MSRDPGDIPVDRAAGPGDLVAALSRARDMPVEAIERAAARPDRIAPAVIAVVERAAGGETLSDEEANLLFWGIHVLAEARNRQLLPPLLSLLRQPGEELERLLGEAIPETLPRMAAFLYDGDWPCWRAALLDRDLDDIARWQLFLATAWLAAVGRIDRTEVRSLLVEMDDERLLGSSDHGWYGWEDTISLLGLADLVPRVDAARADGRLLEGLSEPEAFAATLDSALAAAPDDLSRFADANLGEFGSAVEELEILLSLAADDEEPEPGEPVRNPLRDVGRNDPCPCGSGRKFKRCCLEAA